MNVDYYKKLLKKLESFDEQYLAYGLIDLNDFKEEVSTMIEEKTQSAKLQSPRVSAE